MFAGATLAAVLAGGPATAQEPPGGTGALLVDPGTLTDERRLNEIVTETREALATAGVDALYVPDESREISLREAVMAALERNLTLRRGTLAKGLAERALEEAQAVFDPVFSAAINLVYEDSFERKQRTERYKTATTRLRPGETVDVGDRVLTCGLDPLLGGIPVGLDGDCHIKVLSEDSPVNVLIYSREQKEGLAPSTVTANEALFPGPRDSYTGALAVSQVLPWGGSVDLSLTTTLRDNQWTTNAEDPLNRKHGSYGRPWTSTVVLGVNQPIPGTRRYSEAFEAAVNADLAERRVSLAEFDLRAAINETLQTVDLAYWRLVSAIQRLNVTARALELARDAQARTQRRYDLGLITESDRAQAQAQVARLQVIQQQLFADYLLASEALRELLDQDKEALLLPIGYRALIEGPGLPEAEVDQILANPAYLRTRIAVELARITRDLRAGQTRPDLTAFGSLQLRQSNAVFGYGTYLDSLSNLHGPDTVNLTLGLLFQLPIGDRAAVAALQGAEHELARQELLLRRTELAVRSDFETARLALASAHERVGIAQRNLDLAQAVYDRATRLEAQGQISAYETVASLNRLLDAEIALIQARIEVRTAETRLLASVGALPDRYGERSAQTLLDRERLARLRQRGELETFGGPL